MYINNRWCTSIKIHSKICTPNVEILILYLCPFHLPQEFPTAIFAPELVANTASDMQGKYPEVPMFITGVFNNCRLDKALPSFHQYVDAPTRRGNALDRSEPYTVNHNHPD